jgi:hypothetical protein
MSTTQAAPRTALQPASQGHARKQDAMTGDALPGAARLLGSAARRSAGHGTAVRAIRAWSAAEDVQPDVLYAHVLSHAGTASGVTASLLRAAGIRDPGPAASRGAQRPAEPGRCRPRPALHEEFAEGRNPRDAEVFRARGPVLTRRDPDGAGCFAPDGQPLPEGNLTRARLMPEVPR